VRATGVVATSVFSSVVEVVEELFAVFDEVEFAGEFGFGEGVFGEEAVVGVVVGHEYDDGFGPTRVGFLCAEGFAPQVRATIVSSKGRGVHAGCACLLVW